jgi:hypothetical protein
MPAHQPDTRQLIYGIHTNHSSMVSALATRYTRCVIPLMYRSTGFSSGQYQQRGQPTFAGCKGLHLVEDKYAISVAEVPQEDRPPTPHLASLGTVGPGMG